MALQNFIQALQTQLGGSAGGERERMATIYSAPRDARESLFETFLNYSNQKENTARTLARLLPEFGKTGDKRVLDIGAGEGLLHYFFTRALLQEGRYEGHLDFTLLDPNPNHVRQLKRVSRMLTPDSQGLYSAKVMQGAWGEVAPQTLGGHFDTILCSHTIYHFGRENLQRYFSQMLGLLSPGGQLFVVAREMDDAYELIKEYYTPATGKPFNEITIKDAEPILLGMVRADTSLKLYKDDSEAQIMLPFGSNPEDAHALVSFYLGKFWQEINEPVRATIEGRFQGQNTVLHQVDGIVTVTRSAK